MHKGVIAAAAVLVVFVGAQAVALFPDDNKDAGAAAPSASPTVVVVPKAPEKAPRPSTGTSGMPEPTSGSDPIAPETAEVAAPSPELAKALVAAYYTRSWRDESLRSWQDRVLALGDEEMEHGLVHDYGTKPSQAEKAEWRTVIVKPKGSTRATDVDVLTRTATDAGHAVFEVEFTVEKMTERPATDWDYVFEDTWRVEYAWDGKQWLAHSIKVVG